MGKKTNLKSLRHFCENTSGNFAVMTALMVAGIFGVVGLAVDISNGMNLKTRLTAAADNAILAGTRLGSNQAFDDSRWAEKAEAEARAVFAANIENLDGVTFTPRFTRTGASTTGNATYSYPAPTMFARLIGRNSMVIGEAVQASVSMANFIDVAFLVDNSASMGIGATLADRNIMNAANGNCAFACHQTSSILGLKATPPYMHMMGAKLRIDVVREAIADAVDTMQAQMPATGQIRYSIYTFSADVETLLSPETDIDKVKAAIAKIDLVNSSAANKRLGGTSITPSLNWLANELENRAGDGTGRSPENRQRFAVFFSDGVEDSTSFYTDGLFSFTLDAYWQGIMGVATVPYVALWDISRRSGWIDHPKKIQDNIGGYLQPFVQDGCNNIKDTGTTMMTARIKYESEGIVQRPAFDPVKIDYITKTVPHQISTAFRQCASDPKMSFVAETSSDIKDMMRSVAEEISLAKPNRLTN